VSSVAVVSLGGTGKALLIANDGSIGIIDLSELLKALGVTNLESITVTDLLSTIKSLLLNNIEFLSTDQISLIDTLEVLKALSFLHDNQISLIPILDTNKALLFLSDGSLYAVDLPDFLKAMQITNIAGISIVDATSVLKEIGADLISVTYVNSESENITDLMNAAKSLAMQNTDGIVILSLNETNKAVIFLSDGTIYLVDNLADFLKELFIQLQSSSNLIDTVSVPKAIGQIIIDSFQLEFSHIQDKFGAWGDALTDLTVASTDDLLVVGAVLGSMFMGVIGLSFYIVSKRKKDSSDESNYQ
jgi:hypothetical protein